MSKLTVLKESVFGQRIAEDEAQGLAAYFVETDQWRRLYSGEIDVVYGTKGAGKSALYSLLNARQAELHKNGILLITGENPRGTPAFSNLITDPPPDERHFVALWKLYFASLLHASLSSQGANGKAMSQLEESLEREGLVRRNMTLGALLKGVGDYVKGIFNPKEVEGGITVDPATGLPTGVSGKIVFREPSAAESKQQYISIDSVVALANQALNESKLKAWILLDRLDVAFSDSVELEVNALRALFRAYLDLMANDAISIKIFLRTDIWKRITDGGFREASHITRHTTIEWTRPSILNLIVRRTTHNKCICDYYSVDSGIGGTTLESQEAFFFRVFPSQIDVGPNKPRALDWLITRTQDGQKVCAPREVVHMLNSMRETQVRKLEIGEADPEGENLFSRATFKDSLPEVSKVRLEQTIYAENPNLKQYIEALKGEKTQHTPDTLSQIWKTTSDVAAKVASDLVKIGFFEPRGEKHAPVYWVPFLYRDALDLIQGAAE